LNVPRSKIDFSGKASMKRSQHGAAGPDPPVQRPAGLGSTYRLLYQVGLAMAGGILAGLWAGIKLDALIDGGGFATTAGVLCGIALGVAGAGWLLYRNVPWNR